MSENNQNQKSSADQNPQQSEAQNQGPEIDPQVMFDVIQQKEMIILTALSEKKKAMQIANELQKQNNALQETVKKLTEKIKMLEKAKKIKAKSAKSKAGSSKKKK